MGSSDQTGEVRDHLPLCVQIGEVLRTHNVTALRPQIAAIAVISTRRSGSARRASTQARAGGLAGSIQAS